jgi:hypothetical protein
MQSQEHEQETKKIDGWMVGWLNASIMIVGAQVGLLSRRDASVDFAIATLAHSSNLQIYSSSAVRFAGRVESRAHTYTQKKREE